MATRERGLAFPFSPDRPLRDPPRRLPWDSSETGLRQAPPEAPRGAPPPILVVNPGANVEICETVDAAVSSPPLPPRAAPRGRPASRGSPYLVPRTQTTPAGAAAACTTPSARRVLRPPCRPPARRVTGSNAAGPDVAVRPPADHEFTIGYDSVGMKLAEVAATAAGPTRPPERRPSLYPPRHLSPPAWTRPGGGIDPHGRYLVAG